ncbi:uncharacterized protein FIESC28_02099 [Fusarium coffeatum]|uniref:Uncharacterized protein n=1 Tax=Fusarium coffeatum TaxID=231269 RepID=A0A366S789_9HYPO|nr:uncharacterized protein FIESC28_02099 [Fusarium coffeatum]RBR25191.1 hypothetical protein FIESC28_02099 [Fusarium coffeatum]
MNRQQKRKFDDFLIQNRSGTQKTADEMIKAALDDQLSELAEKRGEDLFREEQKSAALEKERDEALNRANQAEKEVLESKDTLEKVDLMKKHLDNILAIKEAKIASLESQLANINALLREDSPVV